MQCKQTQGFSQNYNPYYRSGGLIGHPGVDVECGYGTPVHAVHDGIAYKVLTPQQPSNDGTGFTAVFQIVDDGLESFEWLTGHLSPSVEQGAAVHRDDLLGTEANHGKVYANGVEITLAMQKAGNKGGAHRHYQKRPIMPVSRTSMDQNYLSANGGPSPYRRDGFYFQIFDYNNGFNGCISPQRPVFFRDLTFGSAGYDVFVLQRLLKRKGFFSAEPIDTFGPKTALAIARYQAQIMGITPTSYFGPKTRAYALRELGPLPNLNGQ